MKEIVAGEDPHAAPALSAAGPVGLRARSQVVWGEHCSECSYPTCYSRCAFYDPRPDLHCRRFLHGIEDAGGGRMRIRFRKWGKLEGGGPVPLRSPEEARRREAGRARVGRLLHAAPLPFQVKRALAHRLNRVSGTPGGPSVAPDALAVEGWSNDGRTHPFTLTVLQGEGGADGGTWQVHLQIGPEPGRHLFPVAPLQAAVRLDQPYVIQLEPVGEAEGIDLTLALVDFVQLEEGVAVAAPPPPVAEAPSRPLAKVLVWDLDETFWTGTLAEDGPDGVQPRPEAVAALKALDARGVLHSIASKNDPAEALAALARFGLLDYFLHPQVGWGPKSASVRAIAAALDLGLDSLVFVDDQPFERAEVESALPSVRTLDHLAVAGLAAHPWFDHPLTAESGRRRSLYRAEAARGEAAAASGEDYTAFLRASRLRLEVRELDGADTERVYELSQRTNQLNFTGARYSREEVADLTGRHHDHRRLSLRCSDGWGDYGLIGFADLDLGRGELRAFFMSCRVQRKRVEHAAFAHMAGRLRERGHTLFRVRFAATERNGASVRLLEELGFDRDGEGWRRPLDLAFPESDIVAVEARDLHPASS